MNGTFFAELYAEKKSFPKSHLVRIEIITNDSRPRLGRLQTDSQSSPSAQTFDNQKNYFLPRTALRNLYQADSFNN
jgi:hypothetical protein